MKYAVISDIHGNYPALEQVLIDARNAGVGHYIFLGDYIFDLPFSNEVIDCISSLDHADFISGNKELYLKDLAGEDQTAWISEQKGVLYQTYRELTDKTAAFISSLKETSYLTMESGLVIYASHFIENSTGQARRQLGSGLFHEAMLEQPFCHKQFLDYFGQLINREDYRTVFRTIHAPVILMGHNHLQGYGYSENQLVINPGSCGQPLNFDNRASYTILEENGSVLTVTERRVSYDVEAVIAQAKKTRTYACGRIWCELVFLALRTGKDYVDFFFDIARRIAGSKGEPDGIFFGNETWREAYEQFTEQFLQHSKK